MHRIITKAVTPQVFQLPIYILRHWFQFQEMHLLTVKISKFLKHYINILKNCLPLLNAIDVVHLII